MPAVDPALLRRAEAQMAADPRVQKVLQQAKGGRFAAGAIKPSDFGIDYLPPGYVYSLGNGKVVQNWGVADKVMTAIALTGMTAGVLHGAGAFGGGGGAGAAPEMSVSTTPLGSAGAVTNAPSMAAGGAAGVGSVAPIVTAAATGGGSVLDRMRQSLTSPDGLASLAGIIGGLATGGMGGGGGASDEQMNQLLEHAVRRTERTDPLHQAVTQLAFSRLPVSARHGINLTGK
jgi:hypothetical protein